jgi:murein DD-endopeptidase MepM/ murein hydrolase activator NlpD
VIYPIQDIDAPVTSGFGYRTHPITGEKKLHNGIDIGIPEGTPIFAPADGKVTTSNETEAGGKQLIITHDNGYKTGYSHLDYRFVVNGQRVKQGQQIANSGATGRVTGAHLHFTLKDPSGNMIDPQKYYFTQRVKKGNGAFVLAGLTILVGIYAIYSTQEKGKKKRPAFIGELLG